MKNNSSLLYILIWAVLYGLSYSLARLFFRAAVPYAVLACAVLLFAWLGYRKRFKAFRICLPAFRMRRPPLSGRSSQTGEMRGAALPKILQTLVIFLSLMVLPAANLLSGGTLAEGNTAVLMCGAVLVEEIFFRGVLLAEPGDGHSSAPGNALLKWLAAQPEYGRACISSGLFAFFHAANAVSGEGWTQVLPQMFCAFCAGMLYAAVTFRTNSLIPAAVGHFFVNITAAEENVLSLPVAAGSILCLAAGILLLLPASRSRFLRFFLWDSK